MTGFFITFEGGEGAGKSTQMALLAASLKAAGHDVVVTREPGGSPGAEAVRHVILSGLAEPYGAVMEAILFATSRNDHVEQVIRPAVGAGKIVICDRFADSSRVYQGMSGALDYDFVERLQQLAIDGMVPDLTVIMDIDPKIGLQRAAIRRAGPADRFEKETVAMHQKRRDGFLTIAKSAPERCAVIDATQDQVKIAAEVLALVSLRLAKIEGQCA